MTRPAIIVNGPPQRYGKVIALDGLSFETPAGSTVGLLGPNGSGKPTTVSVLSTALRPDGGRAQIHDRDVVPVPAEVRNLIGLAGQCAAVDANLTGADKPHPRRPTGRGAKITQPAPSQLLERFDLADAADRLARTYSGGMRRRLDLAAALVHHPKILFLDQPASKLSTPWPASGPITDAIGPTIMLIDALVETRRDSPKKKRSTMTARDPDLDGTNRRAPKRLPVECCRIEISARSSDLRSRPTMSRRAVGDG
jgi:ABC-type branched-subunit amino acid transport system ATPase component